MNNNEVLIKVESVSKKFCRNLRQSLWYGLKDIIRGITLGENYVELRKNEFWAIKDISFEVRRGECLGLIGHNGAGKSTLLKILNGLIRPDSGRIQMHGRVGSLIELGAGFNPLLTGRENVYINGAVLGFSKEEIDRKFDQIVAFSELEEFIDSPIQNYSSGMKVRLGFAVAAQMEPDILLIDEVLAVGDAGFKIKCYNTILKLIEHTAIIFVSHSMTQIAKVCTSVVFLDGGRLKYIGSEVGNAINLYLNQFKTAEPLIIQNGIVKINSLFINSEKHKRGTIIKVDHKRPLKLDFDLFSEDVINNFSISILFYDMELRNIAVSITKKFVIQRDECRMSFLIDDFYVSNGKYQLSFVLMEERNSNKKRIIHAQYDNHATINVVNSPQYSQAPIQLPIKSIDY